MDEAAYEDKVGPSVGEELCAAREAQSLTLAEVAARTRIPQRHLSAIETGDFAGLPAATYSTGFVRTYARLLGLDANALSQRFRAELAESAPAGPYRQEAYEPTDPARVPSRGLVWATLALALIVALGYLYWRGSRLENPTQVALAAQPAEQAPAPASPPPVQQAPVSPAASPDVAANAATGQTTTLTADQPVWLRVTDGGKKLFEGMLQPGKQFEVPADAADPRLRTGRATVLKVTVGNATIPPLGPPETLIKDVSLRPADLLAKAAGGAAPAGAPAQ